jgi:hypothetical protein
MMLGFFQTGIPTRGVRTDSSGTFELTHVAATPHSTLLRVQSKGRSPRWLAVKGLYDGEERGDLEFRMTRGGRIHGVVTNDEGGPREKSVVIAFNQMLALDTFDQPIVVGITAADGSYAIEDLPPGMYSALDLGPDPEKDFSLYRMRLVTITGDEDLTVDFGPRAASADAVIRGRLVDAKGQGIPNAQLLFTKDPRADRAVTDWSPTSTDDSGAFAVRSLATGPYEVFRLTDNTELSQIARIEVTAATKELPPITLTRLRLECSIVDALSSAPVDDTYLILFREDANDGRFVFAGKGPAASGGKLEFTDLLPGRYRIGVSTTDAVHAVAMSDPIVVREGSGPVSAQVALSRAGRLALELKGRGGAPVLHPRLEILNADATDFARVLDIRPANDGSIHIANVPAGSLKLRIFAEGFADHEAQILVTENQETRAAIELIPRP